MIFYNRRFFFRSLDPLKLVDTVLGENHESKKTTDKTCAICNEKFSNYRLLKNHRRKIHVQCKCPCDICGRLFKSNYHVKVHKKSHSDEKSFKCEECDLSFKTKAGVRYHRNNVHVIIPLFQCELCAQTFPVKGGYEKHLKAVHQGVKYSCDVCDKAYRYNNDLQIHKKVHNPDYVSPVCQYCDKVLPTEQAKQKHIYRKHSAVPHKKYVCEICGVSVSNTISLRDHRRIHTGEKPNTCDICGKGFIKASYLTSHVRIHTKEKPYACTMCNKRFTQKTPLTVHFRSIHSKEKPYECHICQKSFVTRGMLKNHSTKLHGISMADIAVDKSMMLQQ